MQTGHSKLSICVIESYSLSEQLHHIKVRITEKHGEVAKEASWVAMAKGVN